MNPNHRYVYLRDANRHPIGCLVVRLVAPQKEGSNGRIEYQLSVVNPIDRKDPHSNRSVRFNKEHARHLALGRLLESPFTVPYDTTSDIYFHEVLSAIMFDIIDSGNQIFPTRAIKAAQVWVKNHSVIDLTSFMGDDDHPNLSSLMSGVY